MGKEIWPCRKKVKRQRKTIILAMLVDLLSPRSCTKIRPQGLFGSGGEDFKGFYHIWAWQPSWSMDRNHLSNLSFPQPKEAPHKFWAKLAQRLQRRSRLTFSPFSHTNVWCPYKCKGKQTWPHRKKVKRQCKTIILANFVDLPSLMICAKIQPQGFLYSGEEYF